MTFLAFYGGIGSEFPRIKSSRTKSPGKSADPLGFPIENQRIKRGGLRVDLILVLFSQSNFVTFEIESIRTGEKIMFSHRPNTI